MVKCQPEEIHTINHNSIRKTVKPTSISNNVTELYQTPIFMNRGHAGIRQKKKTTHTIKVIAIDSIFEKEDDGHTAVVNIIGMG